MRQGEQPQRLRDLLRDKRYGQNEIAIEDEFAARGGSPYSGKFYGRSLGKAQATEVLTQGIERLYDDPRGFAAQDPDYFNFLVKTLGAL